MKRVLLDQGLAPRAAAILRGQGWDAVHVSEVGLDRAEDRDILLFAHQGSRTCVTLDHDFHTHLALTQAGSPSAVFVRLEGLGPDRQADLIRRVWETCGDAISEGAAVSVDETTIRVRRLPLR